MNPLPRRLGLMAVLVLAASPFLVPAAPSAAKPGYYTGKVVPLADVLARSGIRLDRDAAAVSLALVADDGKVYPLIKDEGSRMFYLDKALLNRPMCLTGRTFADTRLLQVLQVHSLIKGELHEVYYWCDICAIKRFEKKRCECCGGPMELREAPVKK
jgi:hypothetical protein